MKKNAYCWYDGPSVLTGEPILAFTFIGNSKNAKMGHCFNYTVYVPKHYTGNVNNMQDKSVCGDCPLKKTESKTCYVLGYQLIAANKWREWYLNGELDFVSPDSFSAVKTKPYLRLGMTGDPASVPIELTRKLMAAYERTISYTHQYLFAEPLRDFSLISLQSREKAKLLHENGFRTARISSDGKDLLPNEVVCAAQRDKKVTCSQCQLCDRSTKNIVFVNHAKNKAKLNALLS